MTADCDTLLIGASFFGYASEIKAALERRGHRVAWFEDRPGVDTMTKLVLRLAPRTMVRRSESYFSEKIQEFQSHPIKHIFVIKGEALSVKSIRNFRAAFPNADFRLYFWDSYRNMPADTAQKVSMFDRTFSFDPEDAKADRRLTYRPLFYLPQFLKLPKLDQDIDFLFIGTMHSDRYEVLERIKRSTPPGSRFVRLLYYPSRNLYHIKRLARPAYWRNDPKEIVFKPIQNPEVLSLLARTRVVVDIERTVQTGYTMRPIEMIAAQKKIITTNVRISGADFYRPNNQLIIDRKNPVISAEFLNSDFQELPEEILKRYSLETWIDDVFGA